MESCLEIRVAKEEDAKRPGDFCLPGLEGTARFRLGDSCLERVAAAGAGSAPGLGTTATTHETRHATKLIEPNSGCQIVIGPWRGKPPIRHRRQSVFGSEATLVKRVRFAVSARVGFAGCEGVSGRSIKCRMQEIGLSLRMKNGWTTKCAAELRC